MESSLQRLEQRWEPAGFPARPFALSLVLHIGLLAWWLPEFSGVARQTPPAAVLHGVLLPVSRGESVAPRAETAPGHFIPPTPTLQPTESLASRRSRPVPPQTQATAAAVSPEPTFESLLTHPGAGGVPVPLDADAKPNVALAPAPPPSETGPDQAGLRQFRLSLAGEARRYRHYPESARQAGLAGTSEVRVAVEAGGGARHAALARSSGHEILDKAALDMLRQAAGRAVLPDSLRGQSFAVLLPVVFKVDE